MAVKSLWQRCIQMIFKSWRGGSNYPGHNAAQFEYRVRANVPRNAIHA
jgi:hypothetical protein